MSIDSKNIGYKFLSEDYSKRHDDGDWKNRRTPPNSFEKIQPWDERTAFQIKVPSPLQEKMDGMIHHGSSPSLNVETKTQVTELPPGYSIVLTLYKDQEFMTNIRFQRKPIIDAYLNKDHPLVVNYLKAHGLRVISQVVGLNDMDRRRILLASNDDQGKSTCVVTNSVAVAVASGSAAVAATSSASVRAAAAAVAAASATASAVVCTVSSGNGGSGDDDDDVDPHQGPRW